MNALDAGKLRPMLLSEELKGERLESAIAIIKKPPGGMGIETSHPIRCLRQQTMTPKDKALVRERWLKSSAKLSTDDRPTYEGRVNAALEDPKTYDYFCRLTEDERLYLDDQSFKAKQGVTQKKTSQFNKNKSAAEMKAIRARESVKLLTNSEAVNGELVKWRDLETRIRDDVRGRVTAAQLDENVWVSVVDRELAAGASWVSNGQAADAQAGSTSEDVRKKVIQAYFRSVLQETSPRLSSVNQQAVRDQVNGDTTIHVDGLANALKAAWLRQVNPGPTQTLATLLGLRLKRTTEGNDFNPLTTVCNLGAHGIRNPIGAHYSVGAEGIWPAVVTDATTADELVRAIFGSGTVDLRLRVHATLETGVTRTPGGNAHQYPHKYWGGEYNYSFREPDQTGPKFNRWNGERYDDNTAAARTRREAGKALVRIALDDADREMRADLIRRAQHILTNGTRHP